MAPAAWFVLVPLAHAALLSGIGLSLGTPWGLIRHYWVALKLVITAFSTVILMIYMGTFRQMAGVAADPVVELGLVRNPAPLLHASLALMLLLGAAVYRGAHRSPHDAQLFTQSRTLRTTQLLGLNSSTGWFDLAAPDGIVARADFHRPSRAAGPRQQ